MRPVADAEVVSPADSWPKELWTIGDDNRLEYPAVLPVLVTPTGNSKVRKILHDGQVLIRDGGTYYNTSGTQTIQNK